METTGSICQILKPTISNVSPFTPFSGRGYSLQSLQPVNVDRKSHTEQNESLASHLLEKLSTDFNHYLHSLEDTFDILKSNSEIIDEQHLPSNTEVHRKKDTLQNRVVPYCLPSIFKPSLPLDQSHSYSNNLVSPSEEYATQFVTDLCDITNGDDALFCIAEHALNSSVQYIENVPDNTVSNTLPSSTPVRNKYALINNSFSIIHDNHLHNSFKTNTSIEQIPSTSQHYATFSELDQTINSYQAFNYNVNFSNSPVTRQCHIENGKFDKIIPVQASKDNTRFASRPRQYNPKDESSEVELVMNKFLAFIEKKEAERVEEEKRDAERERVEEEKRDAWREALKYKHNIPKLSLHRLKKNNDEGWNYLLNWIHKIEANSVGDCMRLHLLRFTADKLVLRLLNLKSEHTDWSLSTSWSMIKRKLFALIPKDDIRVTTRKILEMGMSDKDNVSVFVAKIQEKYHEACELYDVDSLPNSLNSVIAHTVTMKMNQTGRALYYSDILENPDKIVEEMEKSLRNAKFRNSLFEFEHEYCRSSGFSGKSSTINNNQGRSMPYVSGDKGRAMRYRPYTKSKCWFHDSQGGCIYGNSCWFAHV